MLAPLTVSTSRRNIVGRLGAGGAAALLAAQPLGQALAQMASPVASPAALPPLLQAWVDAWNAANVAAIAALYTPDGVYEDVPSGAASTGGDVAGFLSGFVSAVGDIRLTPQAGFVTAEWAALEYLFAGTDKGFIPGAGAQGKPFSVRIATIFELNGNKIQRSSDYYDVATILGQLGLMPAPGATPPA